MNKEDELQEIQRINDERRQDEANRNSEQEKNRLIQEIQKQTENNETEEE